jgi:hypothetical protein
VIGTSAALLMTQLANIMPGVSAAARLAYAAGSVAVLVYAIAVFASSWVPAIESRRLPN